MAYQAIFQRYELKYRLTLEQKQRILSAMEPYMALDRYGRTTVRSVYFDTDSYRLIRRSVEKPVYKEKLRLRSYCLACPEAGVFVELKKKYNGVVYKRRLQMPELDAMTWLRGGECMLDNQIAREITYFRDYYGPLRPQLLLSYEREAYYTREPSDFRVTFDDAVQCRREDVSLGAPVGGQYILPAGEVLMELKTTGGVPLWMTQILSQEKLYKTSFSKYGTAYQNLIYPKLKGDTIHA